MCAPVPFTVRPACRAAVLAGLLLLLLVFVLPASADDGGDDGGATNVTSIQADLISTVSGDGAPFTWHFDYGTSKDYGLQTADVEDPGSGEDKEVTATVTDLQPGTRYHARLTWRIGDETEHGDDFAFTTPGDGRAGAGEEELSDDDTPDDGDDSPPVPALGRSAVTGVTSGSVRVRIPGWQTSAPLAPAARIPVGSVLDARKGTVSVTTALSGGASQTATFHGGIFSVTQKAALGGLTDITLKTPARHACATAPAAAGARAAAARRLPPRELGRLWGSDSHGRYRTHGANSVATVRGTSWLTVERCDGTLTIVSKGAVSVFDRRLGKRVLVRAGGRYLARKG